MERFEEFAHARGPAFLRLGYLLTGDRHLAEDLVQAALVDVYRGWSKVVASDRPEAYARRVLVNTWLGWRRRASSRERPFGPDDVATVASSAPVGRAGADVAPDFAGDLAARDAMWHLLATLPPRGRAVLVLRFYEDADDATIASVLGIGESAVRSTAARALLRLRAGLAAAPAEREALS
ncbi:sigma-70 family RNA polymerase sigma factor [Kineosporia sp. A_224]|uniref:sigma-70 family RNA polymerase sigma factor n=1 Tax=Kineosporia sp. A_224 TaxID=1962180 RepID=UPI0018E918D7|nr:sigma-70 family RNA polymerase sigma factor [Kineosporia sp. A_224]